MVKRTHEQMMNAKEAMEEALKEAASIEKKLLKKRTKRATKKIKDLPEAQGSSL